MYGVSIYKKSSGQKKPQLEFGHCPNRERGGRALNPLAFVGEGHFWIKSKFKLLIPPDDFP